MNELVKTCLTYLTIFFGGSLITVIVIFYVLGESWSKAKIILSDIFRFFGWISIKCRRFSIEQEYSGTINSIIYDYNNGLAEGSVNKLKVIKRIMYGRCNFETLRIKTLRLEKMRKIN